MCIIDVHCSWTALQLFMHVHDPWVRHLVVGISNIPEIWNWEPPVAPELVTGYHQARDS
jgi:hypothetical protein